MPICDTMNFASQIYDYKPGINPSIVSSGSQTFTILTRDANNDAIDIKWYVDDNLVKTSSFSAGSGGETSYVFEANSSLIGEHSIIVKVNDSENLEDLDNYNFQKTHEWTLTVTS